MTVRLSWPLRLRPDGTLATVKQGSDNDVEQCLLATGRTRPGDRWDDPDFGVDPDEFGELPVDTVALTLALMRGEPRRPIDVLQRTVLLDAAIKQIAAELAIKYGPADDTENASA